MRIAFLTHHDPLDSHSWSGILIYMLRSLESHCGEVVSLGPAGKSWFLAGKIAARIMRLAGRNIDPSHTVFLSKRWAGIFKRKLAQSEFDVIFAPVASTEIAFLETSLPIVSYADLTAGFFINYAASLREITPWSVAQMKNVEGRALHRADRLVYASQWAASLAMKEYGVPEEKISVVPMGANLDHIPTLDEILAIRKSRTEGSCRLLFIGVDWERKGGATALNAMRELRARGVNASLTVVGCVPPASAEDQNLEIIPFLDKSLPEQRQRLDKLLLESDFMLFPTRREAYGVVCCEANAFGLPLIASDGGGVPVWNGENGILLRAEASGQEYADTIQALMNDPARYLAMARSGREAFDTKLNWDSWGQSMAKIFRAVSP